MFYRDVLKQLIPLELEGVFGEDLTVEGAQLDRLSTRIDQLKTDIYPDSTNELLTTWEALYQLTPDPGTTLDARRSTVAGKFSQLRDIKKPSLIALATSMGYSIYIRDYTPAMVDWFCAGDEFIVEEPMNYFSAGYSSAGDTLASFDNWLNWIWEVVVVSSPALLPLPSLEQVLEILKPAHVQLNFTYL